MNLQRTACSYHPNKVAVDICERCRRPICLEDKRIYRRRHSSGSGSYRNSYYSSHDFCVLCNSSQLSSDAKWSPLNIVCLIPFIAIFLVVFLPALGIFSSFGDFGFFGFFPFIFIGIFVLIFISIFVSVSKTKTLAQEAENEALGFRNSLNSPEAPYTYQRYSNEGFESPKQSDIFSSSNTSYSPAFSLVCFECGSSITVEDKFCSNCGDSTKEEIEKHY